MKILIAGGGAAGLCAAAAAAAEGASVTVLEAGRTVGEKLSRTGNGRGNIGNTDMDAAYYNASSRMFVAELFHAMPADSVFDFLRTCGIETRTVDGRIYPMSEEAPAVTANLRDAAARCGAVIHTNAPVRSLSKREGKFYAGTGRWTYEADRVILATGTSAGCRDRDAGVDASLARSLGHSLVPFHPALCPLRTDVLKGTSGVRVRASLTLLADGREVMSDEGQVQLTDYGLSGIPAMNLSGTAGDLLAEGRNVRIRLDLLPSFTEEEAASLLGERTAAGIPENAVLRGLIPAKLIPAVTGDDQSRAERLKNLSLRVYGTAGAAAAQVLRGGIPAEEVDPRTMASRICKGAYLCGEILNADGLCGGYNLMFAFAGGILAGKQAAHA